MVLMESLWMNLSTLFTIPSHTSSENGHLVQLCQGNYIQSCLMHHAFKRKEPRWFFWSYFKRTCGTLTKLEYFSSISFTATGVRDLKLWLNLG